MMQVKSKMADINARLQIQQMKEEGDTQREILGIRGDIAVKQLDNKNQLNREKAVQ